MGQARSLRGACLDIRSAQAAQARHQRARNSPIPPAEASPLCAFLRSAQAAQARRQRARNSPLLPGRSESVVREFLRRRRSEQPGPTAKIGKLARIRLR